MRQQRLCERGCTWNKAVSRNEAETLRWIVRLRAFAEVLISVTSLRAKGREWVSIAIESERWSGERSFARTRAGRERAGPVCKRRWAPA